MTPMHRQPVHPRILLLAKRSGTEQQNCTCAPRASLLLWHSDSLLVEASPGRREPVPLCPVPFHCLTRTHAACPVLFSTGRNTTLKRAIAPLDAKPCLASFIGQVPIPIWSRPRHAPTDCHSCPAPWQRATCWPHAARVVEADQRHRAASCCRFSLKRSIITGNRIFSAWCAGPTNALASRLAPQQRHQRAETHFTKSNGPL